MPRSRFHAGFLSLWGLLLASGISGSAHAQILPPGHRPLPPGLHALQGATVHTEPGQTLESATILIRDGKIEAVGPDIQIPPEARVWDLTGLQIYPGLIDPYLTLKPATNVLGLQTFDNDHHAEPMAHDHNYRFFGITGQEPDQGTRGPGYALAQITPERRIVETYSPDSKTLSDLRDLGFTAGNVVPDKGVIRGTSAFVLLAPESPNRMVLRSGVFQHIAFEIQSGKDDAFPRSLMGAIAAIRQSFLDAQDYIARADYFQENGDTAQKPELNLALEALSLAAKKEMPVIFEPGSALLAARAGSLAGEFDLHFAILASGQEWRRPDLLQYDAPFIVPLQFPEVPKLPDQDDWMNVSLDQLRAWDWAPENPALLKRENKEIALTTYALSDRKQFRKNLALAIERGLSEDDALAALTTVPAQLCGVADQLGTIAPGKLANLTVVEGSYFVATNKIRDVWIQGRVYRVEPETKRERKEEEKALSESEAQEKKLNQEKENEKRKLLNQRIAKNPQENRGPLASPAAVLVRGATIWTSAEEGRLERADLLIIDGKIEAVGAGLEAPADATIIDATGKHVTPGLIDCHSHAMILGGVNEATLPSTAMVGIEDVINSETRRILEELAGGLTVANLLHGSANPIGGKNAVIKLRDGASPDGLKFKGAPSGIKFALGENVKQSNWGDKTTTRFPQTRMGVPTFMANRFMAAKRYLEELANFEREKSAAETNGKPVPPAPRRDLELETLAEIIHGDRLIHCHSYRQDEILVFLRLMENFGIKVATLQHVLEGYKVADEIAAHGAGASCFSDWWGYKFEVYDAIPYAGSLMHNRGVLVSFNSDSADLSRRLYTEAAKAVKYGGVEEVEALKFVTINPAMQLGIDAQVGSLEPGKDGDFVLWSRSPLDSRTVCLQTWIEGKKYFDHEAIPARTEALREEREKLVEKARKVSGLTKSAEERDKDSKAQFFNIALEHRFDFVERHCDSN